MTIETANRLYELRKQKGLSQEELAEKLGVSRQAVSKWERSEASPDTDNLIALAKIYDLTLDELIYGKNDSDNTTAESEAEAKDETAKDPDADYDKVEIGPASIRVESKDGDKVKINLKGIHVISDDGDEVKIGLNGIKIKSADDCEIKDVDSDGVVIKDGHFHVEIEKPDNKLKFWLEVPYAIICVIAYLIFGYYEICGGWSAGWIVFVTIPIYYSIIEAIYSRRFSKFAYPVFTAFVFLFLGLFFGLWHPAWIVFITIPIYYSIANAIDRKIKSRTKIKIEQEEQ